MEHLDEKTFNAAFGKRLFWVRDVAMDIRRPQFAMRLGVTVQQLKRFETRDASGFPLYLLPRLIEITFEPYAYWMGEQPSKYWHLRVVKPSSHLRTSGHKNITEQNGIISPPKVKK